MNLRSIPRPNQAVDAAGRSVDVTGFDGVWISSNSATRGIPRLDLELRGSENAIDLFVRPFGLGRDEPRHALIDWSWTPVECIFTDGPESKTGAGFLAEIDHGFMTSRLQVNLKLGVAVVCAFHRFTNACGRRPQFWREFMARQDVGPPRLVDPTESVSCLKDLDSGTFDVDGPVDVSTLTGHWRNTKLALGAPAGVAELHLHPDDGEVSVSALGGDSASWGAVKAEAYVTEEEDEQASAAVLASFRFAERRSVELQIRQNKGILAVTLFYRFGAGKKLGEARRDYVVRELFHRVAPEETDPR